MIRALAESKKFGFEKHFRWRGTEVTRMEALSDAVFVFAVTLLVVSLAVPETFRALVGIMRGFTAFGLCFLILIWIWYQHYIYFRRYGLENRFTIFMNSLLLFVVLFYIFSLKFLFSYFINSIFGLQPKVHLAGIIEKADTPLLMVTYSVGFLVISFIYLVLYFHAYHQRRKLELDDVEIAYTRFSLHAQWINISVALFSIFLVVIGGAGFSAYSGMAYGLIGPLRTVQGFWEGRKIQLLIDNPKKVK